MSDGQAARKPESAKVRRELARYLRSGQWDTEFLAWSGNALVRARDGKQALREALVAEVRRRAPDAPVPAALRDLDLPRFIRRKVAPMVQGLFPATEQGVVLGVLARSITFLTPITIVDVLRTTPWLFTAWLLANLYLLSVGAEPLSEEAPFIVGLSEEATCFVSMSYFEPEAPLADFLVHEAAHVFHNCKRARIGLPFTRRREWLLEIAFRKRETFAYACEAYSRLLELGDSRASRQALLDDHVAGHLPPCESVEPDEYVALLRSAVAARNGWKRILAGCTVEGSRRAAAPGPAFPSPADMLA
jgi:hypothetical protein